MEVSQNDSSGDDISDDESVIENTITDYSGGQASVKKYLNTNPKQIQIKEKTVTWIGKNCRSFEPRVTETQNCASLNKITFVFY